jgi:prevent-host-death family protein
MANYGVAEARNKFTYLLERVEDGETVIITKHGKPVAELRPASAAKPRMTEAERQAWYDEFVKRRNARPPLSMPAAELVRAMRDGDPE